MDSSDIARAIGRIEETVKTSASELVEFKKEQAAAVARIEAKQDYTNGRVRGLELFKARVLTVVAVGIFATPIVLPLVLR